MRLLVTGGRGQLGRTLHEILHRRREFQTDFIDREDLDLSDRLAVERFFSGKAYDTIVNCAAYTNVDKAEEEVEEAQKANVRAVENIAMVSGAGTRIIHISTDYVFDGNADSPYREEDETDPGTTYGMTKLEGERKLLALAPNSVIIRTAWLYSGYGHNFFLTMREKALAGERVRVVSDQWGSPTLAIDLAETIGRMIERADFKGGIYHFTDEGATTWFEFATEIFRSYTGGLDLVEPILSEDFKTKAKRPAYSVLDKTKIKQELGIEIPDWKESLRKIVELDKLASH